MDGVGGEDGLRTLLLDALCPEVAGGLALHVGLDSPEGGGLG